MKIDIWSDYMCPFCYIGERKLQKALEKTGMNGKVEIVFNSYELNPDSPKDYGMGIDELVAKKYGISVEKAAAANNSIVSTAKVSGLEFNFKNLKPTNSFDAHRVSFLAKAEGKQELYTEVVMRSYLTDSLNVSDFNVLTNIAKEVGLDLVKVEEILNSDKYAAEVRADEKSARERNITGVPYFLFNGEQSISGAQDVEMFVSLINKIK